MIINDCSDIIEFVFHEAFVSMHSINAILHIIFIAIFISGLGIFVFLDYIFGTTLKVTILPRELTDETTSYVVTVSTMCKYVYSLDSLSSSITSDNLRILKWNYPFSTWFLHSYSHM